MHVESCLCMHDTQLFHYDHKGAKILRLVGLARSKKDPFKQETQYTAHKSAEMLAGRMAAL